MLVPDWSFALNCHPLYASTVPSVARSFDPTRQISKAGQNETIFAREPTQHPPKQVNLRIHQAEEFQPSRMMGSKNIQGLGCLRTTVHEEAQAGNLLNPPRLKAKCAHMKLKQNSESIPSMWSKSTQHLRLPVQIPGDTPPPPVVHEVGKQVNP
jgi:hypothetical protein